MIPGIDPICIQKWTQKGPREEPKRTPEKVQNHVIPLCFCSKGEPEGPPKWHQKWSQNATQIVQNDNRKWPKTSRNEPNLSWFWAKIPGARSTPGRILVYIKGSAIRPGGELVNRHDSVSVHPDPWELSCNRKLKCSGLPSVSVESYLRGRDSLVEKHHCVLYGLKWSCLVQLIWCGLFTFNLTLNRPCCV